ncbi:DNA polymerase III subunit chi [Catenovulum sediminis]|uniref:DNA polymerase III subunit chi n=1 Tax=Catenovulum sediminis TaxID=1740262 RepID=UPI00117EEF90|nr:DNA polymerase III subunit chi [Catenovulum sediminis]
MTQVTFYIMPEEQSEHDVPAVSRYACELASDSYRNNQRVFILTNNQKQAEEIDETLWQFDPKRFVPHNLQGEGPKFGAPVEIGYQTFRGRRDILINLSQSMPDFARQFKLVYDFVPSDESGKKIARERYKQFRAAGFALSTAPALFANTDSE